MTLHASARFSTMVLKSSVRDSTLQKAHSCAPKSGSLPLKFKSDCQPHTTQHMLDQNRVEHLGYWMQKLSNRFTLSTSYYNSFPKPHPTR